MTIPDAFRRAIWQERDNDALRIALADWLEDHGGEEYAAFVRVQCADAALADRFRTTQDKTYGECHDCGTRRMALRARERDLLAENWHPWSGLRFATYCCNFHQNGRGAVGVRFRRGFVSDVILSWENWSRHHPAVLDAAPLERVVLTTWPGVRAVQPNRVILDGMPATADRQIADYFGEGQRPWRDVAESLLAAEWPRLSFDMSRVR